MNDYNDIWTIFAGLGLLKAANFHGSTATVLCRALKLTQPCFPLLADFVQELYLKELKAYKMPAVKESDSVGQVQTFAVPKTPKSPEEADLASNLQEYESMAVEIEGQDAAQQASGTAAVLPDWLEAEEEEAPKH